MSDLFRSVDGLRGALNFHMSRQAVLASNLANVETPGFTPVDLVREPGGERAFEVALQATQGGHFGAKGIEVPYSVQEDQTAEPGTNGNSVSLDHEMAKLAANDLSFEGAVKIVTSQLAMLRYAANDGNGG